MSRAALPPTGLPRGTLHVLFDADEHTGRFGGVRGLSQVASRLPPTRVSLGYPGNDFMVVGSRGFLRAGCIFPARRRIPARSSAPASMRSSKAAAFALEGRAGAAFPPTHDPAFPFGPPPR